MLTDFLSIRIELRDKVMWAGERERVEGEGTGGYDCAGGQHIWFKSPLKIGFH